MRRLNLVATITLALGMPLWFGSALAAGAGADVVTPGQLYLGVGSQSFTVVVTRAGMTGASGVSLVDTSMNPVCLAPAASFADVSATTVALTIDPRSSCLTDGNPGDVLEIDITAGSTVYVVQPTTPFTLAAAPATTAPSTPPTSSPSTQSTPTPTLAPSPPAKTQPRPRKIPSSDQGVASGQAFTLSASAMSLMGLTYVGGGAQVLTLSSGATVPVMQFSISGSSGDGLTIVRPCTNNLVLQSAVAAGSSATFGGPTTLYVTEFSGTDSSSTPVAFDVKATSAPATWTFVTPYTTVKITVMLLTGGPLTLPNATTVAAFC